MTKSNSRGERNINENSREEGGRMIACVYGHKRNSFEIQTRRTGLLTVVSVSLFIVEIVRTVIKFPKA